MSTTEKPVELSSRHYDIIMDALENFDFAKVGKVMYHLDWRWYDENNSPFQGDGVKTVVNTVTPSESRMRRCARELLVTAARGALDNKTEYTSATGGFRAEAYYCKDCEDTDLLLRLSFCVEEYDNF